MEYFLPLVAPCVAAVSPNHVLSRTRASSRVERFELVSWGALKTPGILPPHRPTQVCPHSHMHTCPPAPAHKKRKAVHSTLIHRIQN